MRKSILEKLHRMGACKESIEWLKKFPSMIAAWKACQTFTHFGWMEWLLYKTHLRLNGIDWHNHCDKMDYIRKKSTRCKCRYCEGRRYCCQVVRKHFPKPPRLS